MRRLILVHTGTSISTASRVANTKKQHISVPNRVKWDKTRQNILVTNGLRSVIGFDERIMREFGAKRVENWIERRCWRLRELPGTESVNLNPLTYPSRVAFVTQT
jgi:hypothetical protein